MYSLGPSQNIVWVKAKVRSTIWVSKCGLLCTYKNHVDTITLTCTYVNHLYTLRALAFLPWLFRELDFTWPDTNWAGPGYHYSLSIMKGRVFITAQIWQPSVAAAASLAKWRQWVSEREREREKERDCWPPSNHRSGFILAAELPWRSAWPCVTAPRNLT